MSHKVNKFLQNALDRLERRPFNKKTPLLNRLHRISLNTGKLLQKRSDRWRNIVTVLQVLLPLIDLETFSWGRFYTNHRGETDFYTYGLDYLVEQTNLNKITIQRALLDLEDVGYMNIKRTDAIGKDGDKVRHYSLRSFTRKFFTDLGFRRDTIEQTRSWKRKRNEKASMGKKTASTLGGKLGQLFKDTRKRINATAKKIKKTCTKPTSPQEVSPRITSNLLQRAASIANKSGREPMDVYRQLLSTL